MLYVHTNFSYYNNDDEEKIFTRSSGGTKYFMVLTYDQGHSLYVLKGIYNNMLVYGWADEGRRYSGYFISTRTNDYGDDDDAIIFFFFIPSSGQSVSQCLLTKHRYRLQLNILIISLN